MKRRGCSIKGVPDCDWRGELRADILPKAGFPGGYGGDPPGRRAGEVKWARGLIRTQSGVKF